MKINGRRAIQINTHKIHTTNDEKEEEEKKTANRDERHSKTEMN